MGRLVVHFEIGRDSAKTQEFYSKLFDWKISPMGPAAMIMPEGSGIAGHISALGHEPHRYTIFCVDVGGVAAYLKKAEALGGKTLVPPVVLPTGKFAWMQDPEGNTVGLWQSQARVRASKTSLRGAPSMRLICGRSRMRRIDF